ncbi:hypothetical protein F4824DRAFT_500989 [Ustulina deusta]|nr:hypothetical protein F4824DRAFT_500989 [Ustulina deusta]
MANRWDMAKGSPGPVIFETTTKKLAKSYPSFNNPSQRLFSAKASKALDLKAEKIAFLEAKVETLEAQIARKAKNKRKVVKLPPGESFYRMTHVRQTKRILRRRIVYADEAADVDIPEREDTDTEDVIQVRNA